MKGSQTEWIVLVALVVVMAGVSALIGDRQTDETREEQANPSTYNPKGTGSKGLYLWLQEIGLQVRRWERPLTGLPHEARVLLILGPRLPLDEQELKALAEWVRKGGVLILADDTMGRPVPGVWAGAPSLAFGLRPRLGGRTATLRPAFASSYAERVETIQPLGRVRFARQDPEGWAPLFADQTGDVMAFKRLGEGTLIAIADPSLFSNARLEIAGHARLVLNIMQRHADGGVVLVDEFHHGHGQRDGLLRYLKGNAAAWILAQAALAFLAFLLARGTRFGAPVPVQGDARASSLEYVGALGDLYRRAGARRLAVEALARSFRRKLTEALGARLGEEAGQFGERAARRFGLRADRVEGCLAPGPGTAASDEALLRFARAVHGVEGRLRRGALPRTRDVQGRAH
jgi:hypothetical protein